MVGQYNVIEKRISGKSYGIVSHKQRTVQERETENNRDIRIAVRSNSATEFLRTAENE